MPKVKSLVRPDPRETAIRSEIGGIMGELMLTQAELARLAGIAPSTLSMRLSKGGIGDMRLKELWQIRDAAEVARMFK